MFGWLKNLFSEDRLDTFRPKEMRIYHYWDGSRMVHADPAVLYHRMMEVRNELSYDLKGAVSTLLDPTKVVKAQKDLIANIRKIFDIQPYSADGKGDASGLTDEASAQLLDHFMVWSESLKKNSSSIPIPWTETSQPTSPSSDVGLPTTNGAVSSSIGNGHSTGKPEPSLSESASPSAA